MRKNVCNFILFILILGCDVCYSQQSAKESTVKAAWVSHFSKFIEWPNINDTTKVFIITILGNDEFEGSLTEIYDSRLIKNKPVVINFITDVEDIGYCHLLYVSSNMHNHLEEVLLRVSTKPILTVGGSEGMGREGVLINFYTIKNRIGFEFNLSAAKRNELEVSFRLLELAKIIK